MRNLLITKGRIEAANTNKSLFIEKCFLNKKKRELQIIMMVKVSSDLFDGEYKVKFTLFEKKRPQITVYDSEITTDKVEKIPHIFKKYSIPGEVRICLYYNGNGKREYGNDMDFLKTLFPWTLEWIYFYQLFKETGKWYGGGI